MGEKIKILTEKIQEKSETPKKSERRSPKMQTEQQVQMVEEDDSEESIFLMETSTNKSLRSRKSSLISEK